MHLPVKVLQGWRYRDYDGLITGWLSYPVSIEDYRVLLIIKNYIWGQDVLLRMQLSTKSAACRERIIRGADLSWIERVVLEDLLRRKCRGERSYIKWAWYRNNMHSRYPKGYQQLNMVILERMKKKADYIYRKAVETGTFDLLRLSLDVDVQEETTESINAQDGIASGCEESTDSVDIFVGGMLEYEDDEHGDGDNQLIDMGLPAT